LTGTVFSGLHIWQKQESWSAFGRGLLLYVTIKLILDLSGCHLAQPGLSDDALFIPVPIVHVIGVLAGVLAFFWETDQVYARQQETRPTQSA